MKIPIAISKSPGAEFPCLLIYFVSMDIGLSGLLANKIKTIEREIDTITKRLLATDGAAAITAYEWQLGKLETRKAVLRGQTRRAIKPQKPFDEMFGLAWRSRAVLIIVT